tara:strand:+ start:383 stop:1210 length:828 start_codon:yes stop_codon:yes gene_type:complete
MYKLILLYVIFNNISLLNGFNNLIKVNKITNTYYKTNYIKSKINILMKFEEEDNDFDINGYSLNKTLFNKNINLNMETELNETYSDDKFPSFYEFLRKRELNELKQKEEYLKKSENNFKNYEKYQNIKPTSKDLKLLSSLSTGEWMRTWIYEMIHVPDYFPTFMYQDMFRMRDFSQKNNSKQYFYIGYYPIDVDLRKGPFYIGAFELVPNMREFRTFIIVQNPYHCAENIYDDEKIKNFKKELMAMCSDALVFFKFDNLQNTSDQRYYYSWLYEE